MTPPTKLTPMTTKSAFKLDVCLVLVCFCFAFELALISWPQGESRTKPNRSSTNNNKSNNNKNQKHIHYWQISILAFLSIFAQVLGYWHGAKRKAHVAKEKQMKMNIMGERKNKKRNATVNDNEVWFQWSYCVWCYLLSNWNLPTAQYSVKEC